MHAFKLTLVAAALLLTGCAHMGSQAQAHPADRSQSCSQNCDVGRKSCVTNDDTPCEAQYEKCLSLCDHNGV